MTKFSTQGFMGKHWLIAVKISTFTRSPNTLGKHIRHEHIITNENHVLNQSN